MVSNVEFFKRLDIFNSLSEDNLVKVVDLCTEVRYGAGDVVINIHDPVDSFYLIREGTLQVSVVPDSTKSEDGANDRVLVTLGRGQTVGEMGLVDYGTRSATVRAETDAVLCAINCEEFLDLCEQFPYLGFQVMRNIAADLSFKLRHNIRI